ncbi:MAG TPA: M10 family metallopeptidase C-terminal domain-containing protein [Azospirillaceae bacterium]|nr:M10 family metallopeptidase C-terminal domain-containing protein [Azospirillaceae bacterium]
MSFIHTGLDGCACPVCAGPTVSAPTGDMGGGIIADGKPVLTPDQAAALIGRDADSWSGATVTFGFRTAAPPASYGQEGGAFTAFSATQQIAARLAMGLWDDVLAPSFREAPEGSAQILFGNTSYKSFQAYSSTPGEGRGGDVWVNPTMTTNQQLVNGQYGLFTLIHEVGHALGLNHPGDYDAGSGSGSSYQVEAQYRQDNQQFTAMSYFSALNNGSYHGIPPRYAATPLLHDVLAAQAIYGPDLTTRTGDTIYGYNSTAGRSAFDFTRTLLPVVTLWDAGGQDTLDLSGAQGNSVVDLRQGGYSDVNGYTRNIAIAFGTQIENAVGGKGADRITGNELPNLITGGAGNDTLEGGAGTDTARFKGNRAGYELTVGETAVTVRDRSGADGTDTLTGIERLAFADQIVDLADVAPLPTATLSNLRLVEGTERGGTALFQLVLTQPAARPVTLAYATKAGTAAAGQDFTATSGTISLAAGQSSALIPVKLLADTAGEGDESFQLVLSQANGVRFAAGATLAATATILDDDPVGADRVAGGPSSTAALEVGRTVRGGLESRSDQDWYRVTLRAGQSYSIDLRGRATGEGSLEDPYVQLYDSAGARLAGSDDDGLGRNGRLTYTPTRDGTFLVAAGSWDGDFAGSYALTVTPGGPALPPAVSVTGTRAVEGGQLSFAVSLSAPSADLVTVWAATEDGTAAAGADYRAVSQAVRFEPGQTAATVTVAVAADTAREGDESLTLRLSTPQGAVLAGGAQTLTAAGTLLDPDGASAPKQKALLLGMADGGIVGWMPELGADGFLAAGGFDPDQVRVTAVADFTGDGKMDLLLQQADGRTLLFELVKGPGGYAPLPEMGNFRPAASGDFAGTGASDVLLRDAASGELRILDIAAGSNAPFLTLSPGFSVVGAGNVDGQGRDDVLFRNDATGGVFAWTGSGFLDLLTVGPGWAVADVGNFTGDRAEDLLLRNTATGTLIFWDVKGGAAGFRDFLTLGAGWSVLGSGDIDGDGRDDVVMRQADTGQAIWWDGAGFHDFGSVLAKVSLLGIGLAF